MDQNQPNYDNLQTWPFEPTEENIRSLRGLLEWLAGVKIVNISYIFDFTNVTSMCGNVCHEIAGRRQNNICQKYISWAWYIKFQINIF